MNKAPAHGSLRGVMRLFLVVTLALASCTPPPAATPTEPTTTPAAINKAAEAPPATEAAPPPLSEPASGPLAPPTLVRANLSGIEIDAITFDSRSHFLAVADQNGGPGSQWPDGRAAGKANSAIAAVNAGFFTPGGEPLGNLITAGKSRGQLNRSSSLGAGFYFRNHMGSMGLLRRNRFRGGTEALQSGPFLIENGRIISGLSTKQSSARTIVAWDGNSRWAIARTGPCSLNSLATALKGRNLGTTRLTHVLNLDGGRSSEIWASPKVAGGPAFERPFWNKPVRNFLILKPKS